MKGDGELRQILKCCLEQFVGSSGREAILQSWLEDRAGVILSNRLANRLEHLSLEEVSRCLGLMRDAMVKRPSLPTPSLPAGTPSLADSPLLISSEASFTEASVKRRGRPPKQSCAKKVVDA